MIEATIRVSRDEDIGSIAPIYQRAVQTGTASWEYEPPTEAEIASRRRAVVDAGFPYFVAECESKVVGYAYASTYRARIGYRFVVENSVYVHEDYRG